MHPVIRNILGVVAGILLGGAVNMGIILLGPSLIPPPEGADMTTMEGLKAAMPLLESKHFIMPWLAHGLGTLVGAFVAALIAGSFKMRMALVVGFFFFLGGLANVVMLPSPMWFNVVDLALAYIPMAWIGGQMAIKMQST